MFSPLTLALVALAALAYAYQRYQRLRVQQADRLVAEQHGCLPPPRLQNQRPFGVDRLEQIFRADAESRLMELFLFHFRQTGSTLEQVFLGTPALGTIEPANLEAMLSTNFQDFDTGPRRSITFPMFGDGIFTQEGAAWKHSRELLRPQLRYKVYEDLAIFKASVVDLLDVITSQADGVVDLQPLFFRFTLDITTEFLFGESVKSLKAPGKTGESEFAQAFNRAQEYVVKRYRLLDLYWLIGGSEFQKVCKDVHTFADQIIDRNLARSTGKEQVFLDAVAADAKDRDTLRGQIINMLAAGRDTTACLLTWTFFLLARHPNVMLKLRAEIASSSTDPSQLTRTDLRNMSYLQNILKETLRLYPSVPVNTRTATRTTVLPTGGGPDRTAPVIVPKGTAIAYSVYSMHRRPDLYGVDAELFRPERWDEEMPMHANKTNAAWGYLPFNGGPRICIGMDFALTEAAYAIVSILLRFPNISLPNSQRTELVGVEKQTMTLVVSSTEGCLVNIS